MFLQRSRWNGCLSLPAAEHLAKWRTQTSTGAGIDEAERQTAMCVILIPKRQAILAVAAEHAGIAVERSNWECKSSRGRNQRQQLVIGKPLVVNLTGAQLTVRMSSAVLRWAAAHEN